jgi:hypothetical protein
MPNLHIIIGDANTRKSSLLRCLTGVGSGNSNRYIEVSEASGKVITVYCMLSALQENYKPQCPAEFIDYVKALNPRPSDIAFTLHVSSRGVYPAFSAYFQAFTQAGWSIASIALLGSSACAQQGNISATRVCAVANSTQQPTNQTATQVRKVWQWA